MVMRAPSIPLGAMKATSFANATQCDVRRDGQAELRAKLNLCFESLQVKPLFQRIPEIHPHVLPASHATWFFYALFPDFEL
jgi:hypothetical protein